MNDQFFSPGKRILWLFFAFHAFFLTAQSTVDTIPPVDTLVRKEMDAKSFLKKGRNILPKSPFQRRAKTETPRAEMPFPTVARPQKYNPADDVMLHPPVLPCLLAEEAQDEFSGEIYRRTASQELFRHTPKALKNYLKGTPNVRCEAALSVSGARALLHLTLTLNDPNPRKAFGKIEKNSLATLWFMDGSSFDVYAQQLDEGIPSEEDKSLVFRVQYALSPEILKKMKRSYLDKVRIAWSSGYEDYEVHAVRLLAQQIRCLVP
jgi:hypothetical protein